MERRVRSIGIKMLWYKGWLETRLRLWIALGLTGILLALVLTLISIRPPAQPGPKPTLGTFFLWMMCGTFPGAGINTQRSFGFLKGLHGSTQYTLSLPVSRFQLLAVRAGLGWLEIAGVTGTFCFGIWLVAPMLFQGVTGFEMFEYVVTVIACISAPYFLSVLLATFLDEQWRAWGAMIACVSIGALPNLIRVPAYTDILRAMGEGSPLLGHSMPWPAMAFSLGLAAVMFFGALTIVQRREY
jgi:ABC-2 type transport system permease protein